MSLLPSHLDVPDFLCEGRMANSKLLQLIAKNDED
jgi:hypothetical protein